MCQINCVYITKMGFHFGHRQSLIVQMPMYQVLLHWIFFMCDWYSFVSRSSCFLSIVVVQLPSGFRAINRVEIFFLLVKRREVMALNLDTRLSVTQSNHIYIQWKLRVTIMYTFIFNIFKFLVVNPKCSNVLYPN